MIMTVEAWRAAKPGMMAKVYFRATEASAIEGAWVWVKVVQTDHTEAGTFSGEIAEKPPVNIGFEKGDLVTLDLRRIDEVRS
jgi:hypothetical protein